MKTIAITLTIIAVTIWALYPSNTDIKKEEDNKQRERIATSLMNGIISGGLQICSDKHELVKTAVEYADLLIAELSKEDKQ